MSFMVDYHKNRLHEVDSYRDLTERDKPMEKTTTIQEIIWRLERLSLGQQRASVGFRIRIVR